MKLEDINQASAELEAAAVVVKKLADEDVPKLNKMMAEAGVPYVTADTRPAR
jgi:hypothetical protein